jgi:hypothetical protein
MRVEITMIIKTATLWDMTLCSLVVVTSVLEEHPAISIVTYPEDGDSRFLQNA